MKKEQSKVMMLKTKFLGQYLTKKTSEAKVKHKKHGNRCCSSLTRNKKKILQKL